MVSIDIHYEGALRCQATHAPSKERLVTDAPVDNHGRGESFSPTDLVATALGSCMLTLMGIAAQSRGWKLEGAQVHVEKHMVSEPTRRIGRLEVVVRVPETFGAEERAVLERAALTCPVHQSLAREIEIPVSFHYGEAVSVG